jgi:hypothetical protein
MASLYNDRVTAFTGLLRSVFFASTLLLGCSRAETATTPAPAPAESSKAPPQAGGPSAPLVLARGVRFIKAGPESDVAKLIRSERESAASDGRDLVVYVGATWCEPCQRFHAAAQRGDLDGDFPQLSILEFDLDEDRDRIVAAGYTSKLIPLFVLPGSDGRASTRRFEGGVKGDRAVAELTPRLRRLLAK